MSASATSPRRRLGDGAGATLLAALGLAIFVLLLYFPLLFTNRVLASGDILLYFYPYRDYAAAALREWRIPLWNPYIFLGVPFLANPQAAVLYPLHWPLAWLPVTKQIYWSAAVHTWLLGFGGWLLLRRWGLSGVGAFSGGLLLAGSGFYGGLIGHLNQMNGAAWLPWGLWILAGVERGAVVIRHLLLALARFALLVALMLLAGHTQTVYINLFGLGVWSLWQTMPWRRKLRPLAGRALLGAWQPLLILLGGTLLGALISAAQLLPTLELSALGLRSGGLSYAEATSFSLKPGQLHWTVLPTYGLADPSALFNTPAYTEFMAHIGLVGLALAVVGAWQGRGTARAAGLLLAVLGVLLALGRWNPLYYLLYKLVPGFDLFRTPARWLMLYTLGLALLAGVGVEVVKQRLISSHWSFAIRHWPLVATLLLSAIGGELLLAARSLPHSQPTAPQAVEELRTAPAHLVTDPLRTVLAPAVMGRFLGMSTITYDPGDMNDWRRIMLEQEPPQLTPAAFDQLIIALKVQELLAPNLSLLWRVPAVDGFDGGVLPLQRYNELLSLFVPPEALVPDGRLREQLRVVPATRLLNLLGVQYLITDKVRDLWFEDIFYDRQIGARLAGEVRQVEIAVPQPFSTTAIGIIGYIEGPAEALAGVGQQTLPVATVDLAGDRVAAFTLTAGGEPGAHLADGGLDSPLAAASGATVAYRDLQGGRQEYGVRLALPAPTTPTTLTVQRLATPFEVVVQAVTLIDERTGMFLPLLPSDRGEFRLAHSGDVKIYENLDHLPRAQLAYEIIGVATADEALAALQTAQVTPGQSAVVEGLASFSAQPAPTDGAMIRSYTAERVQIQTRTAGEALLVLGDTAFPGWVATVDGRPAPIYTTNYLFRGVMIPPGEHTVIFEYRPQSWQQGLWLSGVGVAGWLVLVGWAVALRQRYLPSARAG